MSEARNVSPSPKPDDQGTDHPGRHNPARLTGGHDHQGICALRPSDGPPNGFDEIAVVFIGDEVDQHLGVGVGSEIVALFDQLLP